MPITTRSISKQHPDLETITPTKDDRQVTFKTSADLLPTWRIVLHEQYVQTKKASTATATWSDFSDGKRKLQLPVVLKEIPVELKWTILQLSLSGAKLLTITVQFSTIGRC